jgi:hypothetical protein
MWQITAQRATAANTEAAESGEHEAPPALDSNSKTFLVSSDLDTTMSTRQDCTRTPGDVPLLKDRGHGGQQYRGHRRDSHPRPRASQKMSPLELSGNRMRDRRIPSTTNDAPPPFGRLFRGICPSHTQRWTGRVRWSLRVARGRRDGARSGARAEEGESAMEGPEGRVGGPRRRTLTGEPPLLYLRFRFTYALLSRPCLYPRSFSPSFPGHGP